MISQDLKTSASRRLALDYHSLPLGAELVMRLSPHQHLQSQVISRDRVNGWMWKVYVARWVVLDDIMMRELERENLGWGSTDRVNEKRVCRDR